MPKFHWENYLIFFFIRNNFFSLNWIKNTTEGCEIFSKFTESDKNKSRETFSNMHKKCTTRDNISQHFLGFHTTPTKRT